MAPIKLYGVPMSSCTARVLTCLHEKAVDFELVPVNLAAGDQKKPAFLAKNPFGLVPVIENADLTIFESRAICEYIAGKFKESGSDLTRQEHAEEGALVKQWKEVESHHYNPAIQPIIAQFFLMPMRGKSPDQAVITNCLDKLAAVLDVYEQRLSHSKYLAGDSFTLADLFHLPCTFYFMRTPWSGLILERPHVKAWWEQISSRPAFVKVAQGMKLGQK